MSDLNTLIKTQCHEKLSRSFLTRIYFSKSFCVTTIRFHYLANLQPFHNLSLFFISVQNIHNQRNNKILTIYDISHLSNGNMSSQLNITRIKNAL